MSRLLRSNTTKSHERHGAPNHHQLCCLFNCLCRQTTRTTSLIALLIPCEWNPSVSIFQSWIRIFVSTMASSCNVSLAHNMTLRWRHNGRDSVSIHQPHHCLLNRLFRRRLKKTSKLRVTGLCLWNSPGTGELPAQMASNEENVSIWWRHHDKEIFCVKFWWINACPVAPMHLRFPR